MISPGEFAEIMRSIDKVLDQERAHIEADELMCDLLSELGYSEGVEVFKDMYKWYS